MFTVRVVNFAKAKVSGMEVTKTHGRLRILGSGARLEGYDSVGCEDAAVTRADVRAASGAKGDRVASGKIRARRAALRPRASNPSLLPSPRISYPSRYPPVFPQAAWNAIPSKEKKENIRKRRNDLIETL